jgi:hypothetical protein
MAPGGSNRLEFPCEPLGPSQTVVHMLKLQLQSGRFRQLCARTVLGGDLWTSAVGSRYFKQAQEDES